MYYRVVVSFTHKKMRGQWTSKAQAEKDKEFWQQIVKESALVYVESERDLEE